MTILNIAVSVAVVMLDNIRTETNQWRRHKLYVDLPLLRARFVGQPSKSAFKVISASPGVTRFTFVVLPNDGQSISRWNREVVQDPPGRIF